MKKLLIALAALTVIASLLVLFLVLRLDAEALGARAIAEINQQSGIHLEAGNHSLHPLRGLELADVEASGRLESGEIQARVKLLRMKHRVLPLLRGQLVLYEILLQEPEIELLTRSGEEIRSQKARRRQQKKSDKGKKPGRETTAESAAVAYQDGGGDESLRLSIENLAIQNGTLSIRSLDRQEADFGVAGVNLALAELTFDPSAASSSAAVSGAGRISTGRIIHGDLEASDSSGQIELAGGIAKLTELNVHSANSDLMIYELTVLLIQEPLRYSLHAAGGLDLNGILGVEAKDGFGSVAVEIDSAGEGPEVAAMAGEGIVTLNAGAIPGIPSIVQIEDLVGRALLTGREYERTEIDYRLVSNKIILEPFEIVGEGAILGGAGEIDLAGPLDLSVFVRLPRRGLGSGNLDEEELEELVDEQGMVTVPLQITGTIENPKVELTWDGMKVLAKDAGRGWVEQALEEAKKRAAEWLESRNDNGDDG